MSTIHEMFVSHKMYGMLQQYTETDLNRDEMKRVQSGNRGIEVYTSLRVSTYAYITFHFRLTIGARKNYDQLGPNI